MYIKHTLSSTLLIVNEIVLLTLELVRLSFLTTINVKMQMIFLFDKDAPTPHCYANCVHARHRMTTIIHRPTNVYIISCLRRCHSNYPKYLPYFVNYFYDTERCNICFSEMESVTLS